MKKLVFKGLLVLKESKLWWKENSEIPDEKKEKKQRRSSNKRIVSFVLPDFDTIKKILDKEEENDMLIFKNRVIRR